MWLFMKTERFPVVEIFDSIDGEGKRTGYMATFVRFAGCNLRCSYCDTAYAWDASQAKEWLSEDNLFQQITAYPWKRVTLTGGEPMLQPIETLCRRLGDAGYEVNIETNGAAALFFGASGQAFLYHGYQESLVRGKGPHALGKSFPPDGRRRLEVCRRVRRGPALYGNHP